MKQMDWIRQGPSFVLGCGIVGGTWVASHLGGRWVAGLAGMAMLTAATLAADTWNRRQREASSQPARPSWAALIVVGGFAAASALMVSGDGGSWRTVIPTFGTLGWVTLLNRTEANRKFCLVSKTGEGS